MVNQDLILSLLKNIEEDGFFFLLDHQEKVLLFSDFSDSPSNQENFQGRFVWELLPVDWVLPLQNLRPNLSEPGKSVTKILTIGEMQYQIDWLVLMNDQYSLRIKLHRQKLEDQFLLIQQQLALKLSGSTDLDSVLSSCMDVLFRVSDMDCGGIYLINSSNQNLELKIHRGLSTKFVNQVKLIEKGTDRWNLVKRGLPLYVEYEQLPTVFSEVMLTEGLQSFGLLPLRHLGKIIGCINLASRKSTRITENQRKIFETFSIQIGPAIERVLERQTFGLDSANMANVLDDLQQYFIVSDLDQKIIYTNQFLRTQLGYETQEIINQPIALLCQEESLQVLQPVLFQNNQPDYHTQALTLLTHAGEKIAVACSISFTVWSRQPAYLFLCNQVEFLPNRPEPDLFANLLDTFDKLPVPVLIVDQQSFKIIYANQNACNQYQFERERATSHNYLQFFDLDSLHKFINLAQTSRFSEINQVIWHQITRLDQKIDVRIFINPFYQTESPLYILVASPFYPFEDEKQKLYQDRYRSVLDQQTDLVVRFSPEGIITYVNQAYCDFFGKTSDEMIGIPFVTNVHPSDLDILSNHLAQLTSENPIHESKNRMLDKYKNMHWFSWVDRAIYDSGKLVEIQGVGRNITNDTDQINLELQLRSLVDNAPTIIYILQAQTLYPVFVNQQLETILGFNKQEVFHDPNFWKKQIHPDDFEAWSLKIRDRRFYGDKSSIEFRIFSKSGQVVWLVDQGHLTHVPGQGNYLIGVISDITERKENEARLSYYQRFERLLYSLTKDLIGASANNLADVINNSLRMINTFAN